METDVWIYTVKKKKTFDIVLSEFPHSPAISGWVKQSVDTIYPNLVK